MAMSSGYEKKEFPQEPALAQLVATYSFNEKLAKNVAFLSISLISPNLSSQSA